MKLKPRIRHTRHSRQASSDREGIGVGSRSTVIDRGETEDIGKTWSKVIDGELS